MWVYPDENGYLIYDGSQILKNYIKDNYKLVDILYPTQTYNDIYYGYDLTEYIGNVSGGTYASTAKLAFDGVIQYGEDWDQSDYTPSSGNNFKLLTTHPDRKLYRNSNSVVNFLYNTVPERVVITLYSGNMGVGAYYYKLSDYTLPSFNVISIPIGVPQINHLSKHEYMYNFSGTPTLVEIITNNITHYTYHMTDSTGNIMTDMGLVTLNEYGECFSNNTFIPSKYNTIEFIYKDSLGCYTSLYTYSYDDIQFNTKYVETKKNYYKISDDEKYEYEIGDRGNEVISRVTNEIHSVHTGYVDQSYIDDIMNLFNSNSVYIRKNNELYPIVILNEKYEQNSIKKDRLIDIIINYKLSYEKYSN
jgi:hypothetical protein